LNEKDCLQDFVMIGSLGGRIVRTDILCEKHNITENRLFDLLELIVVK